MRPSALFDWIIFQSSGRYELSSSKQYFYLTAFLPLVTTAPWTCTNPVRYGAAQSRRCWQASVLREPEQAALRRARSPPRECRAGSSRHDHQVAWILLLVAGSVKMLHVAVIQSDLLMARQDATMAVAKHSSWRYPGRPYPGLQRRHESAFLGDTRLDPQAWTRYSSLRRQHLLR
jgi:hypothetical protein